MTSTVRVPRPTPRAAPAPRPTRRSRPELYVVEPARRRLGTRVVVGLAVVVVFAALLASAVLHSLLVSGQDHLDEVRQQIRVEQELLAKDRIVLADHQSPERIAGEAERLGLVPAASQTWLSPTGDTPSVVIGDLEAETEVE